jgi:hypothetical protein
MPKAVNQRTWGLLLRSNGQRYSNPPITPPTAIARTVDSSTQITVQASGGASSLGTNAGYRYRRDGVLLNANATSSALVDSGRAAGTTYNYTATLVDSSGNESDISIAFSSTTTASSDTIPPTVPVISAQTLSASTIRISLVTPSTDAGSGFRDYTLQWSISPSGPWNDLSVGIQAATFPVTHAGLTSNTQRFYRLNAFDNVGNTASSVTVNATTNSSGGAVGDDVIFTFPNPAAIAAPGGAYTFLGGASGYLNTGVSGTDCSSPPTGWAGPDNPSPGAGPGSYYPRFDNRFALSRANSLGFDSAYHDSTNPANGAAFGFGYNAGAAYSEIYEHGYVYYGCRPDCTALQWKVFKEMWLPSIVDNTPQVNYSHWMNGDMFTITDSGGTPGASGSGVYFQGTAPFSQGMPAFKSADRQWYRWEYYHKVSTSDTASDGVVRIRMWRVTDGVLVMDNTFTGIDDFDSARRYQYFEKQNYFGNSNFGDTLTSGGGFAFWDDTWIRPGANARRMVLLGNTPVFSACNQGKLAAQPDVGWDTQSISVRLNKGPQAGVAGLYLFVQREDGSIANANSGYQVV